MTIEDGAVQIQDSVRDSIVEILRADDTRLGDVYRLGEAGKSATEIADELGVGTSGFVSNYKTMIAAMLDGTLPVSTSVSAQIASRLRNWLKDPSFEPETRAYLEDLHTSLLTRADDVAAKTIEDERAKQQTKDVEEQNVPGIYVYTLPHYLRYPFDPGSGRTLLKVGRSERDTFQRVAGQTRITALPEDPVLLRVYPTELGQSAGVEANFHSWLDDANHDRSRSRRGGTEWFLTSLRFLDRIAKSNDLEIVVVNETEVGGL